MQDYIDFEQARQLVKEHTPLLEPEVKPLTELVGHVLAASLSATVASPSVDASLKDGYAVRGGDLEHAGPDRPVTLRVVGSAVAGEPSGKTLAAGQAIRITTGAALPAGADAVLASEFTRDEDQAVVCLARAEPGRNVLARGSDVDPDREMGKAGDYLTPERVGLMASGGCAEASVYPLPRVGLLATGREVVAPGRPLPQGSVYASNLVALAAWLKLHGIGAEVEVVDDVAAEIAARAEALLTENDALLISGGAWTSERDLVVGTLRDMGFDMAFRRVRMGPGKGVAFGLLHGKPVFCLPGGPPSNEMAFLQLALPSLLMMAGQKDPGLPRTPARLKAPVRGQADWVQFWHGRFAPGDGLPWFEHLPLKGRLRTMADSQGLVMLPTGADAIAAGDTVMVQRLGRMIPHAGGQPD